MCNTKVCIVTHVGQITHLVQDYTLCRIEYTVWYYTVGVKLLHKKVSIYCVHSGKIYTGQKKFTQAPPVTNMRHGVGIKLLGQLKREIQGKKSAG